MSDFDVRLHHAVNLIVCKGIEEIEKKMADGTISEKDVLRAVEEHIAGLATGFINSVIAVIEEPCPLAIAREVLAKPNKQSPTENDANRAASETLMDRHNEPDLSKPGSHQLPRHPANPGL